MSPRRRVKPPRHNVHATIGSRAWHPQTVECCDTCAGVKIGSIQKLNGLNNGALFFRLVRQSKPPFSIKTLLLVTKETYKPLLDECYPYQMKYLLSTAVTMHNLLSTVAQSAEVKSTCLRSVTYIPVCVRRSTFFSALSARYCRLAAGGVRRRAGSRRREPTRGRLHPKLVESTVVVAAPASQTLWNLL